MYRFREILFYAEKYLPCNAASKNLILHALDSYLKQHSGRKLFCSIYSQNCLTDLKTKFTKFEFSTTFRFQDTIIYISLRNFARVANYKQNFRKLLHVWNYH